MDPATIGVLAGTSALSGLIQYYNAEKARKATQAQLDKIEATFNAIKPPDYDLSIQDPPELHMETLSLPKFSDPQQAPKFNLDALKPEQFKLIGQMSPEIAGYVSQAEPSLIKKTSDMELGRQAQLSALRRLQSVGKGEFDPQYQQMVQQAARQAQGEAQSRNASIMQDFARRGVGGSGLNLAAQMGSAAQSMDRSAMANQAAASDAYRNRLNALMSGAQLGSQIQSEDTNLQARNNAIINDFNDRMSARRQMLEQQRVASMNDAQQFNLQQAQGVANANTQSANQYQLAQQQRLDDLAKYGANFAQKERERADQNALTNYNLRDSQLKYLNQLLASQSAWKAGEREKQNALKTQMFNNQMGIAQGKSGIANQAINSAISSAQDRNSIIQGLGNASMMGALAYQGSQDRRASQANDANLEYFKKFGTWMDDDAKARYNNSYQGSNYGNYGYGEA